MNIPDSVNGGRMSELMALLPTQLWYFMVVMVSLHVLAIIYYCAVLARGSGSDQANSRLPGRTLKVD